MNKILLVEDEKEIRENIEILLESEGFRVKSAVDGLDALKKIEKNIPDLIISDIMMPFLDGFELYQKVKENVKTKIIPFIFLTAKSDATSVRYGMNLGADDYITKPYASEDLLRAVRIRLEKYKVMNEQIDEIRDSISKYVPHELRTPLVSIMGYAQVIQSDIDSLEKNEITDMVERISIGAKRLHNRIEKFIQLSDLEPINKNFWIGEGAISRISYKIIEEMILSEYIIRDRKDEIEINVMDSQIKIPLRYLKIIIKEVLENAVKFSEPGNKILIDGSIKNKYYLFEVKDFGLGMNENDIDRIGAFKQFNRDIHQQEGNGLGLIFVKRVLQIIGGEMKIESKKREFTKVILKIPLLN